MLPRQTDVRSLLGSQPPHQFLAGSFRGLVGVFQINFEASIFPPSIEAMRYVATMRRCQPPTLIKSPTANGDVFKPSSQTQYPRFG